MYSQQLETFQTKIMLLYIRECICTVVLYMYTGEILFWYALCLALQTLHFIKSIFYLFNHFFFALNKIFI